MRDQLKVKMIFSQALLLAISSVFSSCTSLSFQTKGLIRVTAGKVESHKYRVSSEHIKEFYLWGLVRPSNKVYLDEILSEKGLVSASSIEVQQFRRDWDLFKSIISLGFYIPVRYNVKGFGVRSDD